MTVPQPHARRASDRPEPALAAIDLGSNNCRLLVARPEGDGFRVIDSFSRIVRLGEGVGQTDQLSEAAMARTLAALKVCARIIARHPVARTRGVATEACRRASNGAAFLDRVERVTGLRLELLPSEQEARLALAGCVSLIDPDADHVLLVDIGGGSTELTWLERTNGVAQLQMAHSLPVGVVGLAEGFGTEPDGTGFEAMVREVQGLLAPLDAHDRLRRHLDDARVQLIGTSGTVTTLAAVHLGLPRYDRRRVDGVTVDAGAIAEVAFRLRSMTERARASHPCIGHGRADLVVAGCAILEAVLDRWPVPALRVADRGLREGILHGLMGRSLESALAETMPSAWCPPCLPRRPAAPCGAA